MIFWKFDCFLLLNMNRQGFFFYVIWFNLMKYLLVPPLLLKNVFFSNGCHFNFLLITNINYVKLLEYPIFSHIKHVTNKIEIQYILHICIYLILIFICIVHIQQSTISITNHKIIFFYLASFSILPTHYLFTFYV